MTFMKHCAPSDLDANVGELNSPIQTLEDSVEQFQLTASCKKDQANDDIHRTNVKSA